MGTHRDILTCVSFLYLCSDRHYSTISDPHRTLPCLMDCSAGGGWPHHEDEVRLAPPRWHHSAAAWLWEMLDFLWNDLFGVSFLESVVWFMEEEYLFNWKCGWYVLKRIYWGGIVFSMACAFSPFITNKWFEKLIMFSCRNETLTLELVGGRHESCQPRNAQKLQGPVK